MGRVLLTVQSPDDAARAVRAAAVHAAPGDCVFVVGVPPALPVCAHWVGLTGVAHCPGLREELVEEVAGVVRAVVCALPSWMGVEHRVAPGWRAQCMLDRIAAGCFDEVVLVSAPRRRRDRRALERAAMAGGATLVFWDRGSGSVAADGEDVAVAAPVYA